MTTTLKLADMREADWERVWASLAADGLACLPADTVYGLACKPTPAAVKKIYDIKRREPRRPLALVFRSVAQILATVPDLDQRISELLLRVMPGPVTAILPLAGPLGGVSAPFAGSVGVRVIPAPWGDLYRHLPSPLAVTSANLSGEADPCSVPEIPAAIAAACDFILDAGPCRYCIPSTVVDLRPLLSGKPPAILRQGPLTEEQLRGMLGLLP